MKVRELDPDQVESGSFWSHPDPSRSYGSLQCNLSASKSNWNLSYSKTAGSEILDVTSMDTQLNGLQI
jgi:hypothetical protein